MRRDELSVRFAVLTLCALACGDPPPRRASVLPDSVPDLQGRVLRRDWGRVGVAIASGVRVESSIRILVAPDPRLPHRSGAPGTRPPGAIWIGLRGAVLTTAAGARVADSALRAGARVSVWTAGDIDLSNPPAVGAARVVLITRAPAG